MPRRTRGATAAVANDGAQAASDPNADPDYLALTLRQRKAIDRAFDRATRPGPFRKRRRISSPSLNVDAGGGGGFLPASDDEGEGEGGFMDAGGFIPDDEGEGEGGFMPDDDGDEGGGGFMEDHQDTQIDTARKGAGTGEGDGEGGERRIPLRLLPAILSSLNLPSDEDVLGVFRASASGWSASGSGSDLRGGGGGGRRDVEEEQVDLAVSLKDFRAVCAALMGPDDGEGGGDDDFDNDNDDGPVDSDRESAFAYDDKDDSSLSELSDADGDDEYRGPKGKGKGKANGKAGAKAATSGRGGRKERGKGRDRNTDLEERGRVKLNSRQKEIVNDLWGMLKPVPAEQSRGGGVLGRDEVKRKVRELGEMWTEDEITDMVKLFSTQHEGRGLSYDDFGAVMVRAGLA